MTDLSRRTLLGCLAAAPVFAGAASAADEPDLLTIVDHARGERHGFARADLAAYPQHVIATRTKFTEGVTEFRGPRAIDVIADAGLADRARLTMFAANDYSVDVPVSDLDRFGVILATEMNGRQLTLRTRGPVWLMYPFDDFPELDDSVYLDRLIWQLIRIEA